MQSASKKKHNTEKTLLKVKKYFLMIIDNKEVAIQIVLDLSAAASTMTFFLI